MADSQREYPEEFRRELVGLVRSGRTPESLGRQCEPSAQTIRMQGLTGGGYAA